jgi:WD40 repeat protein
LFWNFLKKKGTASLWDLEGHLLADLNQHKGPMYSAVFSPDGARILTASRDGTAEVWYTPGAI